MSTIFYQSLLCTYACFVCPAEYLISLYHIRDIGIEDRRKEHRKMMWFCNVCFFCCTPDNLGNSETIERWVSLGRKYPYCHKIVIRTLETGISIQYRVWCHRAWSWLFSSSCDAVLELFSTTWELLPSSGWAESALISQFLTFWPQLSFQLDFGGSFIGRTALAWSKSVLEDWQSLEHG